MKSFSIKKIVLCWILLVVSLIVSITACKPSRKDNDLQNEHANTYLTEEEMEGFVAWQKNQEKLSQFHQDLLHQVDNRIEHLRETMPELAPEKQAKASDFVKHLEAQREIFKKKIQELKQANEYNWSVLNKEVDQMADSLESSLKEVDIHVEKGSI